MMRLAWGALAVLLLPAGQDAAKIDALVNQLDHPDWIEQAKAAKELASIGRPAFDALSAAARSESSSKRYWSGVVVEEVYRRGSGQAAAAPFAEKPPAAPPAGPEPVVGRGFAPGDNDVGSVVFICNNPKHGDYECVLPLCRVCGKMKKFAYDYSTSPICLRCSVCKRAYARGDMKCDQCGEPPGPRTGVRMKRN